MPGKKHLRGASKREQRQYEHIKKSAQKSGRYGNRAKKWLHALSWNATKRSDAKKRNNQKARICAQISKSRCRTVAIRTALSLYMSETCLGLGCAFFQRR